MTIVELYDDKQINNIVGTLAFNPEKVIYVGGYSKKHFYNKKMPVLRHYLFRKGYESLIIEYVQVRRDSLKDIVEKLEGIDWDGDDDLSSNVKYLYDADDHSSTIDTTNEIDVLANFGLVPYFISCKNGEFTSEELYKVNSVEEQFGKGYSVKIIVATDIDFALSGAKNVILQRAADMGIRVISGVHEMSDEEFGSALRKAMELPKLKQNV